MDALVLSPETLEDRFAIYPEVYPCKATAKDPCTEKPWNNNATYCRDWKEGHKGKIFIHKEKTEGDGSPDEDTKVATLGNAQRSKSVLFSDTRLKSLIECSKTQVMVMVEYHDNATGIVVPFKVLLDLVPDVNHLDYGKCIADFKTARDASEREFGKAIHAGFYDWQAEIYRDAYALATGEDRTDFLFAVQENTPPYQPALWSIGTDWLSDAAREVRQALEFYCSCLASEEWPGYPISTPILSWGAISREAWMLRSIPTVSRTFPHLNRASVPLHDRLTYLQ